MPRDKRCDLCASDLDLPCVVDLTDVLSSDEAPRSVKCATCSSSSVSKCRVVAHMTLRELVDLAAKDNREDVARAWEMLREAKKRLGIQEFYEWTRGQKGKSGGGALEKGKAKVKDGSGSTPPVHVSHPSAPAPPSADNFLGDWQLRRPAPTPLGRGHPLRLPVGDIGHHRSQDKDKGKDKDKDTVNHETESSAPPAVQVWEPPGPLRRPEEHGDKGPRAAPLPSDPISSLLAEDGTISRANIQYVSDDEAEHRPLDQGKGRATTPPARSPPDSALGGDHDDYDMHDEYDVPDVPTTSARANHPAAPTTEPEATQALPLTQVAILSLGPGCDDPSYLIETGAAGVPAYTLSFPPQRCERLLRPPYSVPMFERATFISRPLLELIAESQDAAPGGKVTLPHYLYRARVACKPCHEQHADTECYIHSLVMDPLGEGDEARPSCVLCAARGETCQWERVWCNDGKNGDVTPPPDPMGVVVVMRWSDRSNVVDRNIGGRVLK